MKTVITHFFNEEYLLPWWLNHHKQIFENGILINYGSTDRSVDIIKQICPHWQIVDTKNKYFDSEPINREVEEYENNISGWRIALNITEFILGDFKSLNHISEPSDIFIPAFVMVDSPEQEFTYPDQGKSLIEQRFYGASFKDGDNFRFKKARKMSNFTTVYPPGRHYWTYNTDSFIILWFGFSPMNESLLNRKLQIQNKISIEEKSVGNGWHHFTDKEGQIDQLREWQKKSKNLKEEIERFRHYNDAN